MSRKMAAICMSTARALVKPTASTVGIAGSRASVVRAHAAAAVYASAAASTPAFGRNAAACRGFVGISAAFVASGSRFTFQQRASFHVSAFDGDDASAVADGGEAAAGPVKLYVGNLSWGVDDVALQDLFAGYEVSDMTIVTDMETGRSRGFGFVTLPDQSAADRAIAELDGTDFDGRPLRVNVSAARSNTFGDRPPREPREPRNYDFDSRKVYFGNLSWNMGDGDLSDICAEYGNVEDAKVITDRETGRSRGFGFITMSTAEEAQAAVAALDGQEVDGRIARVNIANVDK